MQKFLVFLICIVSICSAQVIPFDKHFDVSVTKGNPFITDMTPTGLYGDVMVEVEGNFDQDMILCLQEMTNPPFMTRYSECTVSVELKKTTTTTTTGTTAATTGTTASTTGTSTSASTGSTAASTTGTSTTGSTGTSTTASTTDTSTTGSTGTSTTGTSTTGSTGTSTGSTGTSSTGTSTGSTGTSTTASSTGGATTTASASSKRAIYAAAQPVSLRNVRYTVAVYYKTEPEATSKQTFKLTLSGSGCAAGKTGLDCNDTVSTWQAGNVRFFVDQAQYFSFSTVAGLNSAVFTASADLKLTARFGAVPYGTNFDRDVTGKSLTAQSPSTGMWYLIAVAKESGNVTLGFTPHTCDAGKVGTDCGSSVVSFNKTDTHRTTKFNTSQVIYYAVPGTLNSLIFSARTTATSDKQPKLFAGWNRAPQFNGAAVAPGTFDLSGCNVEACKVLTQLNLQIGAASLGNASGTWYVAVQAQEAAEILVWGDFICPNNCTQGTHGKCQTSGENFGQCKCEPSYSADLLCSEADFLVEYIILIVIAALVAISAIIGLVAWAYMKSKHRGYEPV